ncbi:cation diffusion facilitator family transporter [Synechococcus sp. PCC 7502]|uniref:cation diffusion facilitator family transporter n=1 Tax=Synechococcus sp. PCC 7502 TaxID=1173263 RepID=UPI00029FE859|nr:cation diffusion facilitator family transporter [Synechococcus sp. PCC 7502]AFY75310.1 cation diffusion facilitator family transporter [Synechococcus sp. PCC 7502]
MGLKAELEPTSQKLKLLQLALCLLASLLAVELSLGIFSHSLALLADAEHVCMDVGAIALSLLVVWLSRQSLDGYSWFKQYRLEAIAALVNGISLLVVAGWTIWEAIIRLSSPSHEILGFPMLIAGTVGLIINSINAFYLHGCCHNDLNLKAAFLHFVADMLGSIGAILAAIAVSWLGWNWADGIISILISGAVTCMAISLIGQSMQSWLNLDGLDGKNVLNGKAEVCNCQLQAEQALFPSLQDSINKINRATHS